MRVEEEEAEDEGKLENVGRGQVSEAGREDAGQETRLK